MVASIGVSVAAISLPSNRAGNSGINSSISDARASDNTSGVRAQSPVTNLQENQSARPVEQTAQSGKTSANGEELTEEEERVVQELKQRDAEVRAHEQAHASVGGSYASAPTYEFTVGPDGKRYATSGEVQIDASAVRDNPEATIRKMDIVIRAALAPAEPSSQDLQVAKQAQKTRAKAQAELAQQRVEELKSKSDSNQTSEDSPLKNSPLKSDVTRADEAYRQALGLNKGNENQSNQAIAEEIFSAISDASLFA